MTQGKAAGVTDPTSVHSGASEATEAGFLGGRIRLRQPERGYRAAIDPVFLAAAVPAVRGDMVLDAGAGVGAASLCLAWRVPGCRVSGVELQRDLVRLAGENIELNGFTGRVDVMVGDLTRPPTRLAPGSFAHVMANPPYLEAGRVQPSPDSGKAVASVEELAQKEMHGWAGGVGAGLADWLRFCHAMVCRRGSLTIIHRADRLDALLAELRGIAGGIVVYPLWPDRSNKPAKRVLVRAIKGAAGPMRLAAGMVVHQDDGSYTPAAEAVLRHGEGLAL